MADYLQAVTELNEMISVLEVVDLIGLTFHKVSGGSKVYSCYGHSDSDPSFFVDEKKNFYHCFSCGRKGSVYRLSKDYLLFTTGRETVSFRQIQEWLSAINAQVMGITISYNIDFKADPMKKREFLKLVNAVDFIPIVRGVKDIEQRRTYITGLMKGFDASSLATIMTIGPKQDDLFSMLLEESL